MKKIIEDFFDTFLTRLRNPFIISFLLSWSVYNWKIVMYLMLSDEKIKDKIHYVEKFFTDGRVNYIYPILMAISYVVLMPFLLWLVERIHRWVVIERKTYQGEIKSHDLDIKINSIGKERLLEQRRAGDLGMSELNDKIELLETEKKELEIEKEKLIEVISNMEMDISDAYNNNKAKDGYTDSTINSLAGETKRLSADAYSIIVKNTRVNKGFEKLVRHEMPYLVQDFEGVDFDILMAFDLIEEITLATNNNLGYVLTEKGKSFRDFNNETGDLKN